LIAIYSLDENATRRAAELLRGENVELEVETDNSVVATTRLKALVRRADVVVLVSSKAAHAASNAIVALRDKSMPLLYPSGGGTASIMRALQEFAASQAR